MINEVSAANTPYSAGTVSNTYKAMSNPSIGAEIKEPENEAVSVELSETAKTAKKLISELPPLVLDPAIHLQNAETRLKDVLNKWGIPESTEVDIKLNNDGSYEVSGDHPLLSKIEESLNDGTERELSNHLRGAHSGSIIMRIGEAVGMAMRGADANPAMTETYYNWVKNTVAAEAKSMDYSVSYNGGTLTGSLVNSNGNRIALDEGLSLPVG